MASAVVAGVKPSVTVNVRLVPPSAMLPLMFDETTPVGVEAERAVTLPPRVSVPVPRFTEPPFKVSVEAVTNPAIPGAETNWPEVLTVTAPLTCGLAFSRVTLSLTPLLLELPPMTSGPEMAVNTPAVLLRFSGPSATVVVPVQLSSRPPPL